MLNVLYYFGYRLVWGAVLFALLVLLRFLFTRNRCGQFSKIHNGHVLLFLACISLLAGMTLAPKFDYYPSDGHIELMKESGEPNLALFSVFFRIGAGGLNMGDRYVQLFVIGCLLFAFVGYLLPAVSQYLQKWYIAAPVCFLLSLVIESAQYPLYKGADIDELWIQFVFALLGYSVFLLTHKHGKKVSGEASSAA